MRTRSHRSTAAPAFVAAAVGYAANTALGVAVATRLIDTHRFRWLHHALYITTCTAVAAALAAGWWRGQSNEAAWMLAPAAAPLAAIPFVSTRTWRHPALALAAAPFIAASLVRSLRPADRK